MLDQTKNLYQLNRNKLYAELPENSLLILQSNVKYPFKGDQYFQFNQDTNFFYLTGLNYPNISLIVEYKNKSSIEEILYIPKESKEKIIWEGAGITIPIAEEISCISDIRYTEKWDEQLIRIIEKQKNIFLDFEETENPIFKYKNNFLQKCRKDFPTIHFKNICPHLNKIRLIKSQQELLFIKEAINITKAAFLDLSGIIKPGLKEYEIEAYLDYLFKIKNSSGHAFYPIVASGKNACTLHYTKNNGELNKNDLVLIDFGASYNQYASDCTRTLPVNGKFNNRQTEVYNHVLDIFKRARGLIKPGISIKEINVKVENWMSEAHMNLKLYTKNELENNALLIKKYFPHGIGHFMGLDVHDVGDREIVLQPGMVLTCEPGIYIPEEGLGIRLENDILVTENGYKDLMEEIPIELEDIEKLIQNKY